MTVATIIVLAAAAYAAAGVLFAVAFLAAGLKRIDPDAASGPLLFKLIIAPAAAALWPYLAARVLSAPRPAPAPRPVPAEETDQGTDP